MSVEKIGILHCAGYNENHPINPFLPRTPNLIGRFRGAMAVYALQKDIVDKLVIVGGMPDDRGFPVEEGMAQYVKRIAENSHFGSANKPELSERVIILPRQTQTWETIMDTREMWSALKGHSDEKDLIMFSNRFHLFPRIGIINRLEGLSDAKKLPIEDLFIQGWPEIDYQKILDRITPSDFLSKQSRLELILSGILALDILIPGSQVGRRFIVNQAEKRRLREGKQY